MQNPNTTWKDVNAALPELAIEVLGPPPSSGTRDAFNELALEGDESIDHQESEVIGGALAAISDHPDRASQAVARGRRRLPPPL